MEVKTVDGYQGREKEVPWPASAKARGTGRVSQIGR